MKKLKAKLNKQGGFTLIEMLIVVAIIAILIAISIPIISATLERAREGVDEANERAAIGLAYTYYMTNNKDIGNGETTFTTEENLVYLINPDSHEGVLVSWSTYSANKAKYKNSVGYGQSRAIGEIGDHVGQTINVYIEEPTQLDGTDPVVTVKWEAI